MATIPLAPADHRGSAVGAAATPVAVLSSGQTGTGPSTNIADRSGQRGPVVIEITSTVGATPTVTVAIEGSMDGGDWYPIPYRDTPIAADSLATFAITTATLTRKFLPVDHAWRYVRLNYSANTNVTLSAEVLI